MKFLWKMSRRRPARRITQKNNSIGGVCRLTYCNPKQIGGILIAKLIVAEKPSVAMAYAKVLGVTSRQDGYLEGNGYLVSWCVGHLVELAPPNIYDAKYVKWSIADLPILPQKWQYLVSTSTKKQFGMLSYSYRNLRRAGVFMYNHQLETFICVADAGSFNKAAEESYITPTAIIKQINLLEDSLGVKLFERTRRGLTLTKAGRSMYQDAKYIIQYCHDSVIRARNAMQEDSNVIRIGSSPMTPAQLLMELWSKVQTICPDIKFQIVPFENTPENAREILANLGTNIDVVGGMYEFDLGVLNSERAYITNTMTVSGAADDCAAKETSDFKQYEKAVTVTDTYHETKSRFAWIGEIENEQLLTALETLKVEDLEIITMYAYEGYDITEISKVYGVSRPTISIKIKRITKFLKNFNFNATN